MSEPPEEYDSEFAKAELHSDMVRLHHYLRHIEQTKDKATAREFSHEIFKLYDHARRVYDELRKEVTLL